MNGMLVLPPKVGRCGVLGNTGESGFESVWGRFRGEPPSSDELAHTGFVLLLGLDVNWKSIGASVERCERSMPAILFKAVYTVQVNEASTRKGRPRRAEQENVAQEQPQRRCGTRPSRDRFTRSGLAVRRASPTLACVPPLQPLQGQLRYRISTKDVFVTDDQACHISSEVVDSDMHKEISSIGFRHKLVLTFS